MVGPEDDTASREEIRAFNRSFWCRCSESERRAHRCRCRSPMTGADVWLLVHQGYGLNEIAIMFGITDTRVGQVYDRHFGRLVCAGHYDDEEPVVVRTTGTKPRLWDGQLGHFRFYERAEWTARVKLLRRVEVEHEKARTRHRQVLAIRDLFEAFGRTPTLGEVAGRVGCNLPHLYAVWGYRPDSGRSPSTAREASAALYAAAGLRPRPVGPRGHVRD